MTKEGKTPRSTRRSTINKILSDELFSFDSACR